MEGIQMGSKYRNRGVRAVVSALLATGLGLSVMVMAPAANAVEVPGCENIGQPGVIGTATETGARFTWDEVGNYVYLVQLSRWDDAADDFVTGDYIEVGSTYEYIAPWNENGVVTDAIAATVILFCNPKNASPRPSSVLVVNETASESTSAAVVDSVRLSAAEVYRKTKVSNATINNAGQVKAVIRTKLKKGSPVWACVYELVDAEADKWDEKSCKKTKVKKGGKASIKVGGVKDGDWVEVYDTEDRLLVAWGASGGS
jgi:hypothetical protein